MACTLACAVAAAVAALAPDVGWFGAGLLLGLGAGAGVGRLFLAALSVPALRLGPAFALVQLLRAEAAFLVAPLVLRVVTAGPDPLQRVRPGGRRTGRAQLR